MKKSGEVLAAVLLFVSLITGVLAVEEYDIRVHGYISQGFMISNHNNYLADTKNGTFQFNELGLNFSTGLTEKLQVGIQLAALDLGDLGNDQIGIDWAFADYRWRDWLGIRVGKIKLPSGLYNKTRDVDMLRTPIILPQGIYIETFRDTLVAVKGISGYGGVPLRALGSISYEVLAGTMNIDKDGPTSKGVEARNLFDIEKYEVKKALCWQVLWETPLEGLRLAASRLDIKFKLFANLTKDLTIPVDFPPYTITLAKAGASLIGDIPNFHRTIFSLEYTRGNLVLAAEYCRQDQTRYTRITGLEPVKRMQKFESYYGSSSYRFSDWFETGVYYSVFYKDRDDRDGTGTPYDPPFSAYQKDACLTFRFDMNDYWVFKLEGHLMDGTALCFTQDNLDDRGMPRFTKNWYLLAAKMTFSF